MIKSAELHYDVVIVGGGMTGIAAALASAKNGAKTALVHERPVLGGNASSEIRIPICGASASDRKPELNESGIVHSLILANKKVNDSFNYSIWDAVLFDALKKEKNLTLYLNTTMFDAECEDSRVKHIKCYQMTTERRLTLSADYFADCTGNGTLSAFAGADFRTGSEAKSEYNEPHAPEFADNERMGNSIIFKAINREHPVEFIPPVEVMHFTEEQLKFRKHCAPIPEEVKENASDAQLKELHNERCPSFAYWWLEIPGEITEYEEVRDNLVSAVYGIWNHIKNEGNHEAETYELVWVGMLPGVRESRRIECDYMLNENDVINNRRFDDKIAYGGWYIDNHYSLFEYNKKPAFNFFFEGSFDIPYRSYCVKGFKNLFVGGRCMGATKLGMAATRVMGTCAVGGQAIGTAAAILSKNKSADIRDIDVKALQQTLIKDDCYLSELVNEDEKDLAKNLSITVSSEANGYSVKNITNGITRKLENASNQWRSETSLPQWINLKSDKDINVNEVQITFDSNLEIEKAVTISTRLQKRQEKGVPKELIRDYEVVLLKNKKEVAKQIVKGNFQRLNRIYFDNVTCDEIQINLLSTNGVDYASIFEIRVY